MTIIPRTRHLLCGRCEDPRTSNSTVIANVDNPLLYGIVEAVDPNRPPEPDPIQIGDIVYCSQNAAQRVLVDNNQIKFFVNELVVLGVVRDVKPSVVDATAAPQSDIVVAKNSPLVTDN